MTPTGTAGPLRKSEGLAFALTLIGYFLIGLAGLLTTQPLGYASPFYPAAGWGLAAVLLRGVRMVPAVALGSMGAALVQQTLMHRMPGPAALIVIVGIGLGSALQSYLGAALVRRQVREPEALAEPRDILNFVVAVTLACLVSATIGNFTLLATGTIRTSALPLGLATWWVGDVLGTLIGVPVILAIRGRPREAWESRRLSVGLTLSVLSVLIGVGAQPLMERERVRAEAAFERDLDRATQSLSTRWVESLHALEALHGVYLASEEVTADELRRACEAWLRSGASLGFAWSVPVARTDVPAFEASVRASGLAGYRVHGVAAPSVDQSEDLIVVRLTEPASTPSGLLGLDELSIPGARDAVGSARRTGLPAASRPIAVADRDAPPEVVVYRALYESRNPASLTPTARAAALLGLVSVRIRPADALAAIDPELGRALDICLVDATPDGPPVRIGGATGCENRASTAERRRSWRFADRDWQLRVLPIAGRSASPIDNGDAWLFALVSLISTAMLGGFLLTVTGRARRIEVAVRERTAALQAEIRDRIQAENALRESEQRFRNILDHVPIGVVYTDLDGTVRQTNQHFCRLVSRTGAELVGTNIADLTYPDDRAALARLQRQLLADEVALYRRHQRYQVRHGAVFWVQTTVCLLRGATGQPRSIVSVVEDVTEHRLLEEAERGREAAEASNQAKSDFLSRMSHELRTPLNAMLGFAQLLELDPRQPLAPSQKPWVAQIQQAGWHLLEMINDVLDLSRIESGNLRLQIQTLELEDLLTATIAMVEADAARRSIRIERRLDLGGARPIGDPTRVKQILTNLLTNAVKYNTDGGQVQVSARMTDAEHLELVVADTGLGMTPDQMESLFQPFNRLGRERSGQSGTGIGLVISRRLAELMGGSLEARSQAGAGSAFILNLPCSAEPDTVRGDLEPLGSALADYPRRKVCYVEDNETNVEVMRGVLAQRPQVDMSVALTGAEGLAMIRADRPDLILLDMHLPDIDGLDLLRRLRRESSTRPVPVVIVSADALPEQIAAAFDAGCDRYLTKPVSVVEVLAVIDDLLITS